MTATHHVPTVTDLMLEKVIGMAVSPVGVLFVVGDVDRIELVRARFAAVAKELDAKAIFMQIRADENPTAALQWMKIPTVMEIVVFRGGRVRGRLEKEFTTDAIGRLMEAVLADRYGA